MAHLRTAAPNPGPYCWLPLVRFLPILVFNLDQALDSYTLL